MKKAKIKHEAILSKLTCSQKILQLGMSDGALAHLLVQSGCSVKGLDLHYRNLFFKEVEVKLYSGVHIPFEVNSFDVVLLNSCLDKTNKPESLIMQAAQIAQSRVMVIEKVPISNRDYKKDDPQWNANEKCLKKRMDLFHLYSKSEVNVSVFPYLWFYELYLYTFDVDASPKSKTQKRLYYHF